MVFLFLFVLLLFCFLLSWNREEFLWYLFGVKGMRLALR